MKKTLSIAILSVLFIPLFANASWWNPLSWFDFLKPKTVVVEKIVYVPATTSPIVIIDTPVVEATSTISIKKPDVKPVVKKSTPKPVPKPIAPIIQAVESVIVTPVITPIQPQIDLDKYYLEIYSKYSILLDKVNGDIGRYSSQSGNVATSNFSDFLAGIRADMKENQNKLSLNNKSYELLKSYDDYIIKAKADIDLQYKNYQKNLVRYDAVKYITDNRVSLNEIGPHTYASELLVDYDKTFGTTYAAQFVNMKTLQETYEFAGMFISANSK